jgi:hypothetical protein
MKPQMAVITKRADHANCIRTVQYTNQRYDDTDSGFRFFYGDEDDHVLDRMECFRLIPLEEVLQRMPAVQEILQNPDCAYYHYHEEDGVFSRSDDFASDAFAADACAASDPFLAAFLHK